LATLAQIAEILSTSNHHSTRRVKNLAHEKRPLEPSVTNLGCKPNQEGGIRVKKTIIALVCGLVAPLAFAQTSTTTTEETTTTNKPATTTESTTSTTYETGTVTTYEPGKTIVVRGEQGPVSLALGTAAHIVNAAGQVVTAPLRAGQRVRVYYTGPVEHRTVERVLVED
jgi:hypothetical protein